MKLQFVILGFIALAVSAASLGLGFSLGKLPGVRQAERPGTNNVKLLSDRELGIGRPDLTNILARVEVLEERLRNQQPGSHKELPAAGSGMVVLQSGIGPVLLSVSGVDPFLDGYKITLSLGNPLAANMAGCKLVFLRGDIFDDLIPETKGNFQPQESASPYKFEHDISVDLSAGKWSKVEAQLAPLKLTELRKLTVGIFCDAATMRDAK